LAVGNVYRKSKKDVVTIEGNRLEHPTPTDVQRP
jgi:hypothetical protein